jgi:hypothetical protein
MIKQSSWLYGRPLLYEPSSCQLSGPDETCAQTHTMFKINNPLQSQHPTPIEAEVSELVFFRFPPNLIHEFQSYSQSSVFPTQVTVLHFITLWYLVSKNINKLWSFFKQYPSSPYLIFFLSAKNIISYIFDITNSKIFLLGTLSSFIFMPNNRQNYIFNLCAFR